MVRGVSVALSPPEWAFQVKLYDQFLSSLQIVPKTEVKLTIFSFFSVTCCRDKYPKHLISEWDKWNEENNSENDRPGWYWARVPNLPCMQLQRSKPFTTCYTMISEFREKRYTFLHCSFVRFMFLTFLYVEYLSWFIRDKEPAFSRVSLNRFLQTKRN